MWVDRAFDIGDIGQSTSRIVITGASGWLGQTTLHLLADTFGRRWVAENVCCFGSKAGNIALEKDWSVAQAPISAIGALDRKATWLCHYAFLTKDRAASMDENTYRAANQRITGSVYDALDAIGCNRIFLASSGAARRADDEGAPDDLRLYGGMKRDDEHRFAEWAAGRDGRATVNARIFSLSGAFMNKHQAYALASFILAALADRSIKVSAARPVFRSYVDARELVTLAFAEMARAITGVTAFDSGGVPMEMHDIAIAVSNEINQVAVERASMTSAVGDHYYGDNDYYQALLSRHGLQHLAFPDQIKRTAAFIQSISG